MLEFITIGGGDYFVSFFNAVASLTKSDDFLGTVKVAAAIAFMYAIISASFTGNLNEFGRWFITALLVTQVLLLPKTSLVK